MSNEDDDDDIEMKPKKTIIDEIFENIQIEDTTPVNPHTISYHSTPKTFDNSFSLSKFQKNLQIIIKRLENDELIFDIIGISASLANGFRRIMLSEVPTIAIEKIVVNNNSSVLPDEVLAHRLGLIPIRVNPRFFRTKKEQLKEQKTNLLDIEKNKKIIEEYEPQFEVYPNEDVLFKLKVKCFEGDDGKVVNKNIYSKHLQWIPIGEQENTFKNTPIKPVFDDILICKLAPGQVIDMEIYAQKGIGKVHAKWSPVATASYKLMPKIEFVDNIYDEEAINIKKKCKMKVFDIEDLGNGRKKLIVKSEKSLRSCTMCRECIRGVKDSKILLKKVKDHFIFCIESTGCMHSYEIFRDAVGIFYQKCEKHLEDLENAKKKKLDFNKVLK